jgi:3D (Asp-Asp-Asp) domain-containing protein
VEKVTFRVTAYCSCEKCCGRWALNRPKDENGKDIVYGASGEVLRAGISCASPLPFGTTVELDGYGTVVVEDRTAGWVVDKHGNYIVDIYFDNHETAWNFGCRYLEGVIL